MRYLSNQCHNTNRYMMERTLDVSRYLLRSRRLFLIMSYPFVVSTETADGLATWWRHQMETFSVLMAICAGYSPVPGEFPTQRSVARSFDVYFDLRRNKRISKQSGGWWFETLSWSLWRHCYEFEGFANSIIICHILHTRVLVDSQYTPLPDFCFWCSPSTHIYHHQLR